MYVLNREARGYHRILSLMQMIGLHDRLTLRLLPTRYGVRIASQNPDLPLGEDNLIARAARAFMSCYGIRTGLQVELDKKIPIGAGLGGGSSDAAATLRGLCRLYCLNRPRMELMELGRMLGSDVPFFFGGPTAWVAGTGNEIYPVQWGNSFWAVLVNPGFEVSTAWAYSEADRVRSETLVGRKRSLKKMGLTLGRNRLKIVSRTRTAFPLTRRSFSLHNDLEAITIRRYPVIETIKEDLCSSGAKGVMMSGSGPTVFGLFPDRSSALSAAGALRKAGRGGRSNGQRGWKIWAVRLLERPPV
ncbi:MAG: 4-(cytidine 5'-diphospho)-2-C-methyl-D-erythritol kinase [Nitrospirae bacterium]|nr:4-(cytidine 5'-diphospho)-2-C-methyl-D-erythritol kinase [Nitrospirota bacterium]